MAVSIRKIVFPVGGLGTRFLPATKSMPKEMLPIVDKPLIHYAFEEARAAGIEQFIFITGRNKDAIINHFDQSRELESALAGANREAALAQAMDWLPPPGNIIFIRQQSPLGLGHAVWCARHVVGDEPFAVALADDLVLATTPCLRQMAEEYARVPGCNLIGVESVPREETCKYGILDVAEAAEEGQRRMRARGLVEKPAPENAPSTIAVMGRYILQPQTFSFLEKGMKGAGGEIQLTDALHAMTQATPTYGYRFEGKRFDCGSRAGYVEANLAFALAHPELGGLMKNVVKRYAEP